MRVVHVIPVPHGWSPEQAWEAISRGVLLTDPDPAWSAVEVFGGGREGLGGRMVALLPLDDDETEARGRGEQ